MLRTSLIDLTDFDAHEQSSRPRVITEAPGDGYANIYHFFL